MPPEDEPVPEEPHRSQRHPSINRDMPCINCGYNLRTLSLSGICPECGLAVRESLDTPYTGIDYASDNYAIASAQTLERAGLPAMIEALASDIVYQRKAAAYALAQAGQGAAPAIEQLIAALRDRNADVRWWAAYALGNLGEQARTAALALEQAIQDPDEEVADAAQESLRKIFAPADQQGNRAAPAAANAPGTDDVFSAPLPADPHLAPWAAPLSLRPPAPPPPGHPHHTVMPPAEGPAVAPSPRAPSWAAWSRDQKAAPPAGAPAATGDAAMKWEYKSITLNTHGFLGGKVDTREVDDALNQLGWQGWELVASFDTNVNQGATRQMVFVLKRPMSG